MMWQAIPLTLLLAATLVQSDVMFDLEGGQGHNVATGEADGQSHVDIAEVYFRCQAATLIGLDQTQLCDGVNHCPDGEDEMDDACLRLGKCPQGRHICPHDSASRCIGQAQLCDGTVDCNASGWDEAVEQCPSTASPAECQPGYFKCRAATMEYPSATVCVPSISKCNFNNDCIDGSDEEGEICPPHSRQCPTGMFRCYLRGDDGDLTIPFSHMCIDRNDVCNGANDCFHGEDETDRIEDCVIDERYEIARRRHERTQNIIEDVQEQTTEAAHARDAKHKMPNSAYKFVSSTTMLLLVALAIC